MEYLPGFDAAFLKAEDSDPHVSLAVGALAVVEGPMPEHGSFVDRLRPRLTEVPRLQQVLRVQPLDLSAPVWVDDPSFDLTHHVRRAAVPHPGDTAALFRLAADLMERRIDRDHPLWECWLIEGLSDGQWAILMKLHHCIADGIATMHLLSHFSDEGGVETFVSEIRAAKEPSHGFHAPTLTLNPLSLVRGMWNASVSVSGAVARAIGGAAEIAAKLARPADPSGLAGPVTNMRRYAAVRVPLDEVAHVCRNFDVTINDVALTAITNSYRAALLRRGERPRSRSLPTLVPVSVRSNASQSALDNRVSLMLPYLPVEDSDLLRQLQAVHARLAKAKTSGQRQVGSALVLATKLVPFAATAWTLRVLTRLPQRGVVTVATNVPGPRRRLHVAGREVRQLLPIPPIALGLRTGIAILSYADELVFGITADYDAAPDVDELASGIAQAVARLAALSEAPPRTASWAVPKNVRSNTSRASGDNRW
ncbi:WS/DGAT/MGAT family O-acyltransferase [Mycobacterium shimoidei]|uniref:Diacylglycerol O-acyltransferase n=1 Tax=Mycobacterium shimoidei TaxID=29313 RepID=A0A1E3THZ5_MYCSH|nr:wax ester/triacylglycerol synthase family O-acyltransferase [Mycobacterium shimoidei]MCV7257529.1 wax ester/triacylglycerol synthase family O-acyltransferase [Mycobacterium shimoidei]ODR14001.1 diacylglycerol O-acyltransferase [Mycobacterium shimoidei]SRX94139.1 putative triacylglycerol synthase (diacylglycerol acyltransferase) [Mycobacterium tuberculosis H37Rv] [Mycobacterium shimoidei]